MQREEEGGPSSLQCLFVNFYFLSLCRHFPCQLNTKQMLQRWLSFGFCVFRLERTNSRCHSNIVLKAVTLGTEGLLLFPSLLNKVQSLSNSWVMGRGLKSCSWEVVSGSMSDGPTALTTHRVCGTKHSNLPNQKSAGCKTTKQLGLCCWMQAQRNCNSTGSGAWGSCSTGSEDSWGAE